MKTITKKEVLIWIEEELSNIQYNINNVYKEIGAQEDIKGILFRIKKIEEYAKRINDQLNNVDIKED